MIDSNINVLKVLSNMPRIDEGVKAEYNIEMPGKLLCITKYSIERKHHVMVNVEGM